MSEPGKQKSVFDRLAGRDRLGTGDTVLLAAAGCCIMTISIVFNNFGLLHFEWWHGYVTFHLGPDTIWKKIFDSRTLDQGVYAGRELSYLVDQFDTQAMAFSVRSGFPLFISTTHVLISVFTGVWIARLAAGDLKMGSLAGVGLALLFWTTPYIYLHFFMRTAKGLTTLGLVVIAVEIFRALRVQGTAGPDRLSVRSVATIGLAAFVMSFADRQGFYFLLCAIALIGAEWILSRRRTARDILMLLGAVLLVELGYFFWFAPALTKLFWGYAPDFSFNRLPVESVFAEPLLFLKQSWEVLIATTAQTFGSLPHWMLIAGLAGLFAGVVRRDFKAQVWRRHVPLSFTMFAMFTALWVMYALMILRHPPLLWPDVQVIYYWIPTAALMILGVIFALSPWVAGNKRRQAGVALGVLALTAGNVIALPAMRALLERGHLSESAQASLMMREALLPHTGEARGLPAEVADIPAFRTLLEYSPRLLPKAPLWTDFPDGEFHRRTRGPSAPVRFIGEFGGNGDSRYLITSGRFFDALAGGSFIGATTGQAEMRLNIPVNRLRGEVIVRRANPGSAEGLMVNFKIYAQPKAHEEPRFERWQGQVNLPPGKDEVLVPYEIDGSGLPVTFNLEIPPEASEKVIAGWKWPEITDVGRDSPKPTWITWQGPQPVRLDEVAMQLLLPDDWRPVEAWMRKGRAHAGGIELAPGGEIWLKVNGIVSRFAGHAVSASAANGARIPSTWGLWYKAGRLQTYQPPSTFSEGDLSRSFQAWCAEPGGWLIIAVDSDAAAAPVVVRVTEVGQEK